VPTVQPNVKYEQRDLPLRDLRVCPEILQTRARTDPAVSEHYSRCLADGSVFPPVLVFWDREFYWLADGFHRVDAYRKLGSPTIPSVIRPGNIDDALMAGLDANFHKLNQRPVSHEDRAHAAELMIRRAKYRFWPDTQIARRLGIGAAAVRLVRLRLAAAGIVPLPEYVLCFTDGKPGRKQFPYRPAHVPAPRAAGDSRLFPGVNRPIRRDGEPSRAGEGETLHYKGFHASFEPDPDRPGRLRGRIVRYREHVEFRGETEAELRRAFAASVEDYLTFLASRRP